MKDTAKEGQTNPGASKIIELSQKAGNVNNAIRPKNKQVWPFDDKDIKGLPIIYWHGGNVYTAKGWKNFEDALSIITQLGLTIINSCVVYDRTFIYTLEIRNWDGSNSKK